MHQYKINEYLELRLEGNTTNIYVRGKLFRQCKYLLLNISEDKIEEYKEIESIDEAAKTLDHSLHVSRVQLIPPETEFWGHCSNLQAWAENSYDTRLIHSNLAFPLLEQLYQAGDSIATRVFKEEIAKRYESGYLPVIEYLKENNFLRILSRDEKSAVGIEPDFFSKRAHLDIMVLGDPGVGRRTLVDCLIDGEFKDADNRSSKLSQVNLTVQHKWLPVNEVPYLFFIYTFVDNLLKRPYFTHLFRAALGIILIYDITDRGSFNTIPKWVEFLENLLKERFHDIPILLIGGKSDLDQKKVVSKEEGLELVERNNLFGHIECSAKTGENIKGIFEKMTNKIIENAL